MAWVVERIFAAARESIILGFLQSMTVISVECTKALGTLSMDDAPTGTGTADSDSDPDTRVPSCRKKKSREMFNFMFHLNYCSTTGLFFLRVSLTRNPISVKSTILPRLIGIKQRYPSICPHSPLHLHLFVNRVRSLTSYGQTLQAHHIILVLSPVVAFLVVSDTTYTRDMRYQSFKF